MTESNVPAVVTNPPAAAPADTKQSRSPNEDDMKALLANREKKLAERDQEVADMRARMQELERRIMPVAPSDALSEGLQSLRLREAAGDAEAHTQLEIGRQAAQTQIDLNRTKAMIQAKVTAEDWAAVERMLGNDPAVTQSKVKEALKLARGLKIDDVETENSTLKERLAAAETALEKERTRPRVPNMALRPAAVPHDANTITAAEFREALKRGGEEARQLKARVNSARGADGHLDIDYSKK
jgi:chromosome segregation ATPase